MNSRIYLRIETGLIGIVFGLGLWMMPIGEAQAGYASIVIDAQTGHVLHEVNPDTRNHPASLTKMMTLYMVFDALRQGKLSLNSHLPVSKYAASMVPTKLGLKPGGQIQVKHAILALVTKSANDAAVVLAEALGGTESGFADKMTARARRLGMDRTRFRNASGLTHSSQLSTARDMATLALALIRDFPREYRYFSTREFSYRGHRYTNHNKLLDAYRGTDGIKTGYTRAAGYNLVASARRDGRRLVAVVFGGKSSRARNQDVMALLDRGFGPTTRLASRSRTRPLTVRDTVTVLDAPKTQLGSATPGYTRKRYRIAPTQSSRRPSKFASGAGIGPSILTHPPTKPAPAATPSPNPFHSLTDSDTPITPGQISLPRGNPKPVPISRFQAKAPAAIEHRSKPIRGRSFAAIEERSRLIPTTPAPLIIPQLPTTNSNVVALAEPNPPKVPTILEQPRPQPRIQAVPSETHAIKPLPKPQTLVPKPTRAQPTPAPAQAPVPVAKRPRPERPDVRDAQPTPSLLTRPQIGAFGVQVGAFKSFDTAQQAAERAVTRLPNLLSNARVWIAQGQANQQSVYLARLIGLTKSRADSACQQLKNMDIDCMSVKIGNRRRTNPLAAAY